MQILFHLKLERKQLLLLSPSTNTFAERLNWLAIASSADMLILPDHQCYQATDIQFPIISITTQPIIFFKYSLRPLSYKLNWLKKSISKNSFIFIDMHIIEIFLKLPKLQIKVWIFLTSLYSTLKYDERGKSQNLNS